MGVNRRHFSAFVTKGLSVSAVMTLIWKLLIEGQYRMTPKLMGHTKKKKKRLKNSQKVFHASGFQSFWNFPHFTVNFALFVCSQD